MASRDADALCIYIWKSCLDPGNVVGCFFEITSFPRHPNSSSGLVFFCIFGGVQIDSQQVFGYLGLVMFDNCLILSTKGIHHLSVVNF